MESYNMTIRYIGVGSLVVAALALIVVAALARREPPPRLVGVRGTENQADQAEPEREETDIEAWLKRAKEAA